MYRHSCRMLVMCGMWAATLHAEDASVAAALAQRFFEAHSVEGLGTVHFKYRQEYPTGFGTMMVTSSVSSDSLRSYRVETVLEQPDSRSVFRSSYDGSTVVRYSTPIEGEHLPVRGLYLVGAEPIREHLAETWKQALDIFDSSIFLASVAIESANYVDGVLSVEPVKGFTLRIRFINDELLQYDLLEMQQGDKLASKVVDEWVEYNNVLWPRISRTGNGSEEEEFAILEMSELEVTPTTFVWSIPYEDGTYLQDCRRPGFTAKVTDLDSGLVRDKSYLEALDVKYRELISATAAEDVMDVLDDAAEMATDSAIGAPETRSVPLLRAERPASLQTANQVASRRLMLAGVVLVVTVVLTCGIFAWRKS